MNQISLKNYKDKPNKWWMKMRFLLSVLIISQFYSFHHKVVHLSEYNDKICVECIVTTDYIDLIENDYRINYPLPDSKHTIKLTQSVYKNPPDFYFSRAPPFIT